MNLPPNLAHAIENAHYMGHSIQAVVAEYEQSNDTKIDPLAVAQFMQTLPPVCRSCSI